MCITICTITILFRISDNTRNNETAREKKSDTPALTISSPTDTKRRDQRGREKKREKRKRTTDRSVYRLQGAMDAKKRAYKTT